MRPALLLMGALGVAGCGAPTAPGACILPAQKPMVEVDFYFGRDIAGHPGVTDAAWADFAATQIAPRFADGFTVLDAAGQWRDPRSGTVTREASKLVRVVTPGGGNLSARVEAVSLAYRQRFHQEAVGIVSAPVCAAL
jgi:hypothetical protein